MLLPQHVVVAGMLTTVTLMIEPDDQDDPPVITTTSLYIASRIISKQFKTQSPHPAATFLFVILESLYFPLLLLPPPKHRISRPWIKL
jgi:hypothetical protein